ncbi:MAG TPA: EAL domain-containing response regulator [Planctomycetota bacterium]|nr:EAL domain-containing response regulator [Planctomycetota bacterium]
MVGSAKSGPPEYPLRRVLILDDDSTTLLILSHSLQIEGLEIIACREIEAAEAILDHSRMDVVITDLCLSPLGGLDGTRLVRHVSTHFPEIDLFVMSSHVTEEVRRLMIAFGASAVLEKPVDPKILALQVVRGQRGTAGPPGVVFDVETLDDFLEANPIFAVLQPIVSIQTDAPGFPVFGVESLARAPRESLLRDPELLFSYASRKERLYETDMICIRAALLEAVRLGRSPTLFINVQPRSLTKGDFADRLSRMVQESGFTPAEIVLELTEQETILNPRAFASMLLEVRRRGFRVALDDYGLGYSNLRFLMEFRPEFVKISGHFCKGISQDRSKREIVRSTAEMLRRLVIPGIMECVETQEELRIVRELGIEYGQGYHFSRPLRAEELLERGLVRLPDRALAPR